MNSKKKTILITGINGFLGSHLVNRLIKDYEIIGLTNEKKELHRIKEHNCKVYYSQHDDIESIFIEHDLFAVVHTATVYTRGDESLKNLLSSNIVLPIILFEFANKYKINRFVNTDSFFNDKTLKYEYLAEYSLSKKHSLEWIKRLAGPCKLINMKIFHMYGPNDSASKFVPYIVNALSSNVPRIELTPGEQKRDFIYIDDVVEAYRLILSKSDSHTKNYEEFEVGTGNLISVREFVQMVKDITNSRSELIFGALPYRKNEIMESKANNSNLEKLGWSHQYSLSEGIQKLIL